MTSRKSNMSTDPSQLLMTHPPYEPLWGDAGDSDQKEPKVTAGSDSGIPPGINASQWLLQLLKKHASEDTMSRADNVLQNVPAYSMMPPSPSSTVTDLRHCPNTLQSRTPVAAVEEASKSLLDDVWTGLPGQDSNKKEKDTYGTVDSDSLPFTPNRMHGQDDCFQANTSLNTQIHTEEIQKTAIGDAPSSLNGDESSYSGSHAGERNLESFRYIMSLKSSLQFSSSESYASDLSTVSHTSFPLPFSILESTTVLLIMFPSIKSLSMVRRHLFGNGDRDNRCLLQTQTGCRYLRLFKATLMVGCSCFLCICHDTEYGAHHAAETCIATIASKSSTEVASQLHTDGIEIRLCNTHQFASCISKPFENKQRLEEDLLLGTISRCQWGRALYNFALLRDASSSPCPTIVEDISIVWQRSPFHLGSLVWMTVLEVPPCSNIEKLLQNSEILGKIKRIELRYEFQFYLMTDDEEEIRNPYILATSTCKKYVRLGLKEVLSVLLVMAKNDRDNLSEDQ